MGLLAWVIFGALAGWVAGLVTGTKDQRGCIGNIIIGIIGAFVGGLLMQLVTGAGFYFAFNLPSFIVAVIGAVVMLTVVSEVNKRR